MLLIYMKVIEIGMTTGLLGGEVEQSKTVAAEVGPVVVHLQGVADRFPLFVVKTIGEGGLVGAVGEVHADAEIKPTHGPTCREGYTGDFFAHSIAFLHRAMHNDEQLTVLFLYTHEAIAVLEATEACIVAILQAGCIKQYLAFAGWTEGTLGERVASLADMLHYGGRCQTQPAFTLGEAPSVCIRNVVPLPAELQAWQP